MALFNMIGSIFQASGTKPDHASVYYSPKETFTGRTQRGKLNKSDISSPSNFKHVTHVGFNSMPGLDVGSDVDLKRLFNLAGVQEEHLRDQELAHNIFDVIQKEGGIEAVRRQARRMTSVERPTTRTRLRSLSSSSLTPSKRQNCPVESSPHAAKIAATLAGGPPLSYLPSWSKIPPPHHTHPPLGHFPSMAPLPPRPPYLGELSQVFSPVSKPPVFPRSKEVPPPLPQFLSSKTSMKVPPPPKGLPPPPPKGLPPSIPNHATIVSEIAAVPPPLPQFARSIPSNASDAIPASFSLSSPNNEPAIKFGDPPLPSAKNLHSGTVIPSPLSSESLPSTNPTYSPLPPPPPPLPFKKQTSGNTFTLQSSPENLFKSSDSPSISEVKKITCNPTSKRLGVVVSSKNLDHQNDPILFLDQIKQGVQLKSVSQAVKVESTECSNLVTALMDVIKRRHKAIHSSDDEDDEWED